MPTQPRDVWKDGGGLVAPVFQLYRFWGEDGVWWRLVSPNGRGLARSAVAHPTVASARSSLEQVLSRAEGLELGVRLTPDYRWHWSLRMAGTALVEGIGDQDRRVRCLDAGRKFQLLAPVALVEPEVAVFRHAGRMPRVERRGGGRAERADEGAEARRETRVEGRGESRGAARGGSRAESRGDARLESRAEVRGETRSDTPSDAPVDGRADARVESGVAGGADVRAENGRAL